MSGATRVPAAFTALQDAPWLVPGDTLLAYCRASTDEQDRSCPQQVRDVAAFWTTQGKLPHTATLPACTAPTRGTYVDDGYSGFKTALDERPASIALLEFCAAHPQPPDRPGIITVWALSRLGRFPDGPMEAFHWVYRFHRMGWRLWSITEGDFACTDEDRLLKVLKFALYSEKDTASSEDKSRSVARGKRDLREHGLWQGSFPPFGYDRWAARVSATSIEWLEPLTVGKRNGYADPDVHTLLKPNADAVHVRQIYQWAAAGEGGSIVSLADICARMNATSARPYITRHGQPHGKAWYPSTVSRVLSNEAYLGIQLDAAGTEYPARWEALIDRVTWQGVRMRLRENAARPRAVNTPYVLTGLLVCAACRARYWGERLSTPHGVVTYYRTGRVPGRPQCAACIARVRADVVEPALIAAVSSMADAPEVRQAIAEEDDERSGHGARVGARRRTLLSQREAAKQEVTRLLDLAGLGGEAALQARARLEVANHDMARLTAALEHVDVGAGTTPTISALQHQARHFDRLFAQASMEERKRLLRCFLVQVEVDTPGEALTVHYRRPVGVTR